MGRAWIVVALALGGCRGLLGIDSPSLSNDAAPEAVIDAPCTIVADFNFCSFPVTVLPTPIETSACTGGVIETGMCVFHVDQLIVASGTTLPVTGSVPLVILSDADITIDGTLDVGSHAGQVGAGANDAACGPAKPATQNNNTGGGGAGGSFHGTGGKGGDGGQNNSSGGVAGSAFPQPPERVRGGCGGESGSRSSSPFLPGAGGGGVWLATPAHIAVSGAIEASGAAGSGGQAVGGGGNGGGSGGMIRLTANVSLAISGSLVAAGGGGGGAGAANSAGSDGADGKLTGGLGGIGAGNGGDGGTGATDTPATDGQAADPNSNAGGGGGGGAAGFVLLESPSVDAPGMIVPRN